MFDILAPFEEIFTHQAALICRGCKHKKTLAIPPLDPATGVTKRGDYCRKEKRKGTPAGYAACSEVVSGCEKFKPKRKSRKVFSITLIP